MFFFFHFSSLLNSIHIIFILMVFIIIIFVLFLSFLISSFSCYCCSFFIISYVFPYVYLCSSLFILFSTPFHFSILANKFLLTIFLFSRQRFPFFLPLYSFILKPSIFFLFSPFLVSLHPFFTSFIPTFYRSNICSLYFLNTTLSFAIPSSFTSSFCFLSICLSSSSLKVGSCILLLH